jgi:hypothetical protein
MEYYKKRQEKLEKIELEEAEERSILEKAKQKFKIENSDKGKSNDDELIILYMSLPKEQQNSHSIENLQEFTGSNGSKAFAANKEDAKNVANAMDKHFTNEGKVDLDKLERFAKSRKDVKIKEYKIGNKLYKLIILQFPVKDLAKNIANFEKSIHYCKMPKAKKESNTYNEGQENQVNKEVLNL